MKLNLMNRNIAYVNLNIEISHISKYDVFILVLSLNIKMSYTFAL